MRSSEDGFVFRFRILTEVIYKEAAVAGIEAKGEIVQHQQVRVLRQDQSSATCERCPQLMVLIFCLGVTFSLAMSSK